MVLNFNTDGYQGTVSRSVTIYSSDRNRPQVKLTVRANIEVVLSFEPKYVYLEGHVDDDISRVVTIRAHEDKPLTLKPSKLSTPEDVGYELQTIEAGRIYRVILHNTRKKHGLYRGFLTLMTNYPEKPEITIRFEGVIRGKR